MGINTALGTGEQFLPWIDIRDLVRLYRAILEKKLPLEILNATASQHVKMNELSKVMLHRFKKHSFLPNPPEFLIKLLFGEMAVMLLEGSKVSNEKLLKHGFSFEYDSIDKALCQE